MTAIYQFRRPDGQLEDVSSGSYLQAVAGVPSNWKYVGAGGAASNQKGLSIWQITGVLLVLLCLMAALIFG